MQNLAVKGDFESPAWRKIPGVPTKGEVKLSSFGSQRDSIATAGKGVSGKEQNEVKNSFFIFQRFWCGGFHYL